MFIMQILLFFLIGLSLVLPLMAQELPENPESLKLKIEGKRSVTNQVAVETGLIEETEAPAMLKEEKPQDKPGAPTDKLEEAAPSTNTAVNAKLSFLMNTGIQYAEEGEYEEAERAYLRALETDPDNEVIQFRLSTLYLLTDRYVEAVEILEALVAEYPDNSQVRNNLAWAYATGEGVRNNKKALRHAREAILSAPISPSMWNTLAEAYYMGGDYERAERASEHAIDLMIQTDPGQAQLADFQAQLQKIRRAEQALKRFQGLDDEE
jgi:Flp pilus assembly protein TadD